jgi:hypothetical protein
MHEMLSEVFLYIIHQLSMSLYPSGGHGQPVSLAPPGRKLIHHHHNYVVYNCIRASPGALWLYTQWMSLTRYEYLFPLTIKSDEAECVKDLYVVCHYLNVVDRLGRLQVPEDLVLFF